MGGKVKSSGCCKFMELDVWVIIVWLICLPYLLVVGGCDIVLGVQWLSTVSPVLWDFQLLTMQFSKNNKQYKLHHHNPVTSLVQEVSLQLIDKELANSNLGLFLYSMEGQGMEPSHLQAQQLQELHTLLGKFEEIFNLPSQLPPSRTQDHHIPLCHGAKPLNLRPYHYGALCKNLR